MQIYKSGQGTSARWISAIALGALAAFGCYELQIKVVEWNAKWEIAPLNLGIAHLSLSVLVSGVAFIIAAILIGWLVNLPKFVDYLIMSEVELKKVSWPTRTELKRQTTVVIVTLVVFSVVLLVADLLFSKLSQTFLFGG